MKSLATKVAPWWTFMKQFFPHWAAAFCLIETSTSLTHLNQYVCMLLRWEEIPLEKITMNYFPWKHRLREKLKYTFSFQNSNCSSFPQLFKVGMCIENKPLCRNHPSPLPSLSTHFRIFRHCALLSHISFPSIFDKCKNWIDPHPYLKNTFLKIYHIPSKYKKTD